MQYQSEPIALNHASLSLATSCPALYLRRIKARGLLTRDNNYFNNKYITGALSPEGIISG